MSYRIQNPLFLAASIASLCLAANKDSSAGSSAVEEEAPKTDLKKFLADHPIVEVGMIELKKLVIDAGTQPRVAIDNDVVQEYAEEIKKAVKEGQPNPFDSLPDDKLPTVFRDPTGRCVLADGFHRHGGHKMAHEKEMKVSFRDGTERDALIFSLSTNKDHGVRRTRKDVQRALKIALKDPDLASSVNTDIANFVGCSEFMVREHRAAVGAPTVRTATRKGKKIKIDTSRIGKKGGKKASKDKPKKAGKTTKSSGATVQDDTKGGLGEMHREIIKIKNLLGGKQGEEFEKALLDGSLELTKRDLREWAALKDATIKSVAPLVLGGARMRPYRAYEFVSGGIPEKMQEHLHNLAIGSPGGVFEMKGEGFTVVVTHKGK